MSNAQVLIDIGAYGINEDIECDVSYVLRPEVIETKYEYGEPEKVDLVSISFNCKSILFLLSNNQVEQIEKVVLKKIQEARKENDNL